MPAFVPGLPFASVFTAMSIPAPSNELLGFETVTLNVVVEPGATVKDPLPLVHDRVVAVVAELP